MDNADSLIPVVAGALQARDEKGTDSNTKPGHLIPIAFSGRQRGDDGRGYDRNPQVVLDRVGTLDTVKPWNVAYRVTGNDGAYDQGDKAACLNTATDPTQQVVVSRFVGVRRLTPRECEKLMGWPVDHTAGFADSTRYKMCGNGVVASEAEWIGRRIMAVCGNKQEANA